MRVPKGSGHNSAERLTIMTFTTTYHMTMDKVRSMCIEQNYCTECDNEQYDELLSLCKKVKTLDDVLPIAEQIMQYSDTERLMSESGCNETELLENICFNLINDCIYITVELA